MCTAELDACVVISLNLITSSQTPLNPLGTEGVAVLCSSDITVGQRWCTSRIHFSSLQRNVLSAPADECRECEETIVPGVRQLALIIECDSIRLALGRYALFPKPQNRKCLNYTC